MKNLIKWKTIENHEARHWYDTDTCHTLHTCKIKRQHSVLCIMDSDARHNTRCDSTSYSRREWCWLSYESV